MSQSKLDSVDRNIIKILQQEGRIANKELAERIGLTTTPHLSVSEGWKGTESLKATQQRLTKSL